jgi:hypothetical protein
LALGILIGAVELCFRSGKPPSKTAPVIRVDETEPKLRQGKDYFEKQSSNELFTSENQDNLPSRKNSQLLAEALRKLNQNPGVVPGELRL